MSLRTRSPLVLSGVVDGQALLFNLHDRQLHLLNHTGAAVWDELAAEVSAAELTGSLAATFRVPVIDIRDDIAGLLDQFDGFGLCVSPDEKAEEGSPRVHPSDLARHSNERSVLSITLGPFFALSVSFAVEVEDELLRAEIDTVLDPLRQGTGISGGSAPLVPIRIEQVEDEVWSLTVGDSSPRRLTSRSQVVRRVVAEVNGEPLNHLRNSVVFHAAAAEFEAGVVLFPGISNAGKSTLISQLVHRGHGYITDEAACVGVDSFRVEPFTKSITVEPGSHQVLSELILDFEPTAETVYVDPRRIGPGRLSTGGHVAAIIFPTFREGIATELTALTRMDTFRRLLTNTFAFDLVGQRAFDAIVEMANEVPAFTLQHSGTVDHLEAIERMVSDLAVRA